MTSQEGTFTVPGLSLEEGHKLASALQDRLHALNDLQLTLKHAHWNVVGRDFIGVHEMLDPQIDAVRRDVDTTAERMATMGVSPHGTPGAIVKERSWDDYSLGRASCEEHLAALDIVYAGVIADHREAIEVAGEIDPITEDMLIGQTAGPRAVPLVRAGPPGERRRRPRHPGRPREGHEQEAAAQGPLSPGEGEDFRAGVGDDEGVLELRGVRRSLVTTVQPSSHMSQSMVPSVSIGSIVNVIPGPSRVEPRVVVVRDDQPGVERRADPVTGEVGDDAVAEPLGVGLDHAADHVDLPARTDRLDRAAQRLLGAFDQQAALLVDVADEVGRVGVPVHAADVRGDVDVDDVAVLELTGVGDPVADALVDRRAERLGKPL